MGVLKSETILSRNERILTNEIGTETVMMSIDEGRYYGLNKTGNYIWRILEKPLSFGDLCANVAAEFNLTERQCKEDVEPFIEELTKEKILKVRIQ